MTDRQEAVDLLASTGLLGDLPGAVQDSIAAHMHRVQFKPGELIFARGDPGDAIYLVVTGRVRLSILTREGRELSFAHAVTGEIFGEIAVLDGSSRSADATALDHVTALSISGQHFNRLIEQHASLARAVIRFLCARLRNVSDHLEDIALLPLEARLARFLLDRIPVPDGEAPSAGGHRIRLGISQSELALLIGATRQKVNAALMHLEQSGAIRREGQAYACNRRLLQQIAQREETIA